MSSSIGRSLGLAAARRLLAPSRQGARPLLPALNAEWRAAKPLLRPFGTLGAAPWRQIPTLQATAPSPLQHEQLQTLAASPTMPTKPEVGSTSFAAPSSVSAVAEKVAAAEGSLDKARSDSMVFEIGLTFTFMHYQSIFIYFARGLFQAVRPLLILFVFGQILKAVFFVAGAPIWCSFYSIWMFEVIYGLAQCAISFIFICSFYNNLSFNRLRPTLNLLWRQEKDKLARAARAIGM
eukprot:CAMPEP_0171175688 /NCGR_PEP_ID=MMETSP0790-20130122/11355_1 /TAXON_ID=2925 /ORGANISM="Alexandrium catenella, Strain OF101" /LENGTH=235 /DNA_ID=CAMNT_0011640567 /DNA_START=49 /DNA_END=756 /DNA_ORIENTATION=+